MAEKTNNYELAYHIDSDLDEAQAAQAKETIETLVTSQGGIITFSKQPEKIRLSYEINHKRASYFGYLQFTMPDGENLIHIDEQMRLDKNIFRHLTLKLEPLSARQQKAAAHMKTERPAKKAEAPVTEETRKEMEKQLEDVIGNL